MITISKLSGRHVRLAVPLLIAFTIATAASMTYAETTGAVGDTRLVYNSEAPAWLRAVGKLKVPGSKYRDGRRAHLQEDCSGTLVTRTPGGRADTVITAWHCLATYNDLSKAIVFTLSAAGAPGEGHEAYRLADGGGMYADWAILRLRQPLPTGLAMTIHPGRADAARPVSMAGYSTDKAKGDGGKRLTFDPACFITGQGANVSDSNCRAYKGASGGAVVQLSHTGTPQYSGVISEGDSAGVSTFVPVATFRSAINLHLR